MKKHLTIILGVLLVLGAILVAGFVALKISLTQGLSSPRLTVAASPAATDAEIWLIEEGFQDRGFTAYAKSPNINGGKPERITTLDWDSLDYQYYFRKMHWSKDGQVAVFTIEPNQSGAVQAFAYDFSTGQAVLPDWQRSYSASHKTPEEWQEWEQTIINLVESHGGIGSEGPTANDIRDRSREIWYWEIPRE